MALAVEAIKSPVEDVDHLEPMSKVLSIVVHDLFKQVELVDLVGPAMTLAEVRHCCQDCLAGCCCHDELVELGHVEVTCKTRGDVSLFLDAVENLLREADVDDVEAILAGDLLPDVEIHLRVVQDRGCHGHVGTKACLLNVVDGHHHRPFHCIGVDAHQGVHLHVGPDCVGGLTMTKMTHGMGTFTSG